MVTWRNQNADHIDEIKCVDCGTSDCTCLEVCSDQKYRCCADYNDGIKSGNLDNEYNGNEKVELCEACEFRLGELKKTT